MKKRRYRCVSLAGDPAARAAAFQSLATAPIAEPSPLEQPPAAFAVNSAADRLIGARPLGLSPTIAKKAKRGHARPPTIIVDQFARFLRGHLAATSTEPLVRTQQRAEKILRSVHHPGLERFGTQWLTKAKRKFLDQRRPAHQPRAATKPTSPGGTRPEGPDGSCALEPSRRRAERPGNNRELIVTGDTGPRG
jgi:hypothetical protein